MRQLNYWRSVKELTKKCKSCRRPTEIVKF